MSEDCHCTRRIYAKGISSFFCVNDSRSISPQIKYAVASNKFIGIDRLRRGKQTPFCRSWSPDHCTYITIYARRRKFKGGNWWKRSKWRPSGDRRFLLKPKNEELSATAVSSQSIHSIKVITSPRWQELMSRAWIRYHKECFCIYPLKKKYINIRHDVNQKESNILPPSCSIRLEGSILAQCGPYPMTRMMNYSLVKNIYEICKWVSTSEGQIWRHWRYFALRHVPILPLPL